MTQSIQLEHIIQTKELFLKKKKKIQINLEENYMTEFFRALEKNNNPEMSERVTESMRKHAIHDSRVSRGGMHPTRGRRAEYVVPVLSARFSSSLEGRCRADTLFASPGLRK